MHKPLINRSLARPKLVRQVGLSKSLRGKTETKSKHKSRHSEKESGVGSHIKKYVGKAASWGWDWIWRKLFGATMKDFRQASEKLTLENRQSFHYFGTSKDSKDTKETDQARVLKREVGLLRSSIRSMAGSSPVKVRLNIPFALTATVTSGVVSTITNVDASASTEFASLAAIFDEYKIVQGEVLFTHHCRNLYVFATTSAGANDFLVLGYDTDNVALTSVSNGLELAQHKLFTTGNAGGAIEVLPTAQAVERFEFKVPEGILATTSIGAGQWCMTSNPQVYGRIKSYNVGTEVVAKVVSVGFVYLDCEFRIRT